MELFAEKQLEAPYQSGSCDFVSRIYGQEEGRFDGALALCLVQT